MFRLRVSIIATITATLTAATLATSAFASGVPSPWTSTDIGNTRIAGSASYAYGKFTIKGSGSDIWATADAFHYVYQHLNGDGEITARVASQQNTNSWARAGVMIRESLSSNSREAIAATTPGHGASFSWRASTGGNSVYVDGKAGSAPYWVRLNRTGNLFTAYKSANGTSWTKYGQQTITMGNSIYVGLAVTSHNNYRLATDTFDYVSVNAGDTTAPTVAITAPADNTTLNSTVTATATASDNVAVAKVVFALDGKDVATDTSAPYSYSLDPSALTAGAHQLTAKAYDAAGNTTTSSVVHFTVPNTDTERPNGTVTAPVSNTTIHGIVTATVHATDNVAPTKVVFYLDPGSADPIFGTSTTNNNGDFSVPLDTTKISNGTHSVAAYVYDAAGNSHGTAWSTFTVDNRGDTTAPTVSITAPANNATLSSTTTVKASAADNIGVTKVEFYIDSTKVATDTSAPYEYALDPSILSVGAHQLTAKAYDAAGNTATSSTIHFSTQSGSSSSRDPLKQPFASSSIWNMPIGSNAVYAPANLPSDPGGDPWSPMPQVDADIIILKPGSPMTNVVQSNAGWSGANRCSGTGGTLVSVPIPTNFTIPNSRDNNSAAILLNDGRTIVQMQPFTRCSSGGSATSLLTFPNVDIYGDGISGAHGGSRMSAIGGTIRLGELRPGQLGMHHALKVNVNSTHDLYNCSKESDCFRWPALTSDSGSTGDYGTDGNNQNQAMKMGALLAIPASVNINSLGLTSEPGKELAWTLQNYGAYIVDSTGGPAFAIEAENGPDGSVASQFQSDYGYPLEERVNDNTPWSTDMQKIVAALHVVNNNSPTSIGGGGTPRQPLAAPIAP